ncbi:helix-hairpin-helix domain-containing protein [Saliphagus infecundisoli]|uniref:Helix-hairpin-helix domain-containing protein n=1 Tax=Saliphagus infecundisoli TaxID=1849069 RepID=A0ABD5QB99_9EURY|nr:helix-hairpin-helix domain-containing protein [Saliphagus infecundisoli]
MVLLQKIKALLGLGDSEGTDGEDREVGVTVERSGSTDDAATTGTTGPATADEPDGSDELAEGVPDETVLGEESVEIEETGSEPDPDDPLADEEADDPLEDADDSAGEPEDAAAAGADAAGSTGSITEPADSPEEATEPAEATGPSEEDAVPEPEADAGDDQPVETIKGIGPAYAERLADAGVETVGDLAAADSEELAAETGIAPTRVQGWIDRVNSR